MGYLYKFESWFTTVINPVYCFPDEYSGAALNAAVEAARFAGDVSKGRWICQTCIYAHAEKCTVLKPQHEKELSLIQ